ncbi:MAG: sugar phosphate isomerase/epimerase [Phycisphaeraceae bacterium]|nr:sugar phosphate isomerase/epimerase [Phycisphaeraceae bacterium]
MRLGCCGSIPQAGEIKQAGFDFLEVNVQQVLRGDLDDQAYLAAAPKPDQLPLPIEAANCLVPGSMPLIGPARNLDLIRQYMTRVAARAKRLGIARLVFGSGGARRRPEGVEPRVADDHLAEFLQIAGDLCGQQQVMIVIEHLHRGETNTLNSLAQARELADRVNHPHVAVLVDSYHFSLEKEEDEALLELGNRLAHVHIAEPVDRLQPLAHADTPKADQAYDFEHFFSLLWKIGYQQRISIESQWSAPIAQVGPKVVSFLQEQWAEAKSTQL